MSYINWHTTPILNVEVWYVVSLSLISTNPPEDKNQDHEIFCMHMAHAVTSGVLDVMTKLET